MDVFNREWALIEEQKLKQHIKWYGLCKQYKQPNTGIYSGMYWCQSCNSRLFQQNFKNWTSGNPDVDKLIQVSQLNAKNHWEVLEWIEYDRLEDVEYITKGGFGKVYKAKWKCGYIYEWDYETNQWKTWSNMPVALKSLNNSKNITPEFL